MVSLVLVGEASYRNGGQPGIGREQRGGLQVCFIAPGILGSINGCICHSTTTCVIGTAYDHSWIETADESPTDTRDLNIKIINICILERRDLIRLQFDFVRIQSGCSQITEGCLSPFGIDLAEVAVEVAIMTYIAIATCCLMYSVRVTADSRGFHGA